MIAILTGDIIQSQRIDTQIWLPMLEEVLATTGKRRKQWDIFRGDSFQVKATPENALSTALLIKAGMKRHKELDVRISIGVGEETYKANDITTSNGPAYVLSGEAFEALKKQRIAIATPWLQVNEVLQILFQMAWLSFDEWTPVSAAYIYEALKHPHQNQQALAERLGKNQGNISIGLSRGHYAEMLDLIEFYTNYIRKYVHPVS